MVTNMFISYFYSKHHSYEKSTSSKESHYNMKLERNVPNVLCITGYADAFIIIKSNGEQQFF